MGNNPLAEGGATPVDDCGKPGQLCAPRAGGKVIIIAFVAYAGVYPLFYSHLAISGFSLCVEGDKTWGLIVRKSEYCISL